jgi:hypothetical protein
VRALLGAGEGDAVELASWATSGEVALFVRGEFDTVQGPAEGHSEMCDILILLKVESVFIDIIIEWLRP